MKQVVCIILALALWLLLVWSVEWYDLLAGLFFAMLVGIILSDIYPDHPQALFNPRRIFWALVYIPYFFYYVIRANLDVAYRVLHPDMPIRPGIVKVRTALASSLARTLLANSITLTPGTLSVDVDGQDLYIHWINVRGDSAEEHTELIVRRFERMLKEIFE
jgi:multicomponent Na+:H+ antiporter subunit E